MTVFHVKKFLFLIFLLLFSGVVYTQNYSIVNYSQKDGLPGDLVSSICPDSRGYLWFGTEKGLYRFDGRTFRLFKTGDGPLPAIREVFRDHRDNIWLGLDKGGLKCLPVPGNSNPQIPKIIHNKSVFSIAQDADNRIWFGTNDGLYSYDGNRFYTYPEQKGSTPQFYLCIAVDKKNRIWGATLRNGIQYFENKQQSSGIPLFPPGGNQEASFSGNSNSSNSSNLFKSFKLPDAFKKNRVLTILFDSKGTMWMGTDKGLLSYRNGKFKKYTTEDGLSDNLIISLYESTGGEIWIATSDGLNVLSPLGGITAITVDNGLGNSFVYSISRDREGNIWAATHQGASCVRSLNIKHFSKNHGLPDNSVYDIHQDRSGAIWIGTGGGLCRCNGKITGIYTYKDGLPHNSVHSIVEDKDGKLWVGTMSGLAYFDGKRFNAMYKELGVISEMILNRNGNLWIASNRGLAYIKNGSIYQAPFKRKVGMVFYLTEDSRGNLWFSSDNGLFRYSLIDNNLTQIKMESKSHSRLKIEALFEDSRGNVWIGSDDGVDCYFPHTGAVKPFRFETGLPNAACNMVTEDGSGHIWLGTTQGLVVYNGETFKTFTAARHGMSTDFWNTGIMDRNGNLWIGGLEGVTTFKPPLKKNNIPPPIHISSVKVLEEKVPLSKLSSLNHEQNYIRFQFTGICFSAPKTMVYRYKLEPIDKEWQETSTPSVFFPFLPAGKFRFLVKAVNNDGVESDTPAIVPFEIRPPFWKTWWFPIVVFIVAFSLSTFLIMWWYKREGEKAELRAKNRQLVMAQRMELMGSLAAGTVHDLKNLLSIILGYTRVIGRKYDRNDEDYRHIETIKETADTAVRMSKQILDLARYPDELPGELELWELLTETLETFRITLPKNIEICCVNPSEPVHIAIHAGRFQQLVINLCQNAVHAMPDGGTLTVTLSLKNHEDVLLKIRDTGTGIPPEARSKIFKPLFTTKAKGKGTGLGLFVVKQIVDEYGGNIDVESELGIGTEFSILLPRRTKKHSDQD